MGPVNATQQQKGNGKGWRKDSTASSSNTTESSSTQPVNKHILYFNVPLHGHVNPTLDLVAELIKRGYKVTYYASEKFKSRLEAIGATLVCYDEGIQFKLTRTEKNIFNTALEMLTACELIMDSLTDSIGEMTDLGMIMYDVSALWGKFFASKFRVPSVCCFPGLSPQWRAYMNPLLLTRGFMDAYEGSDKMQLSHALKKRILTKHNIIKHSTSKLFAGNENGLNIVCTSAYFQPGSDYLGDNYVFLGPVLGARKEDLECIPWDTLSDDVPLIYISMGTLYYQDPAFFTLCMNIFKNEPYNIIMSVGSVNIADMGEIPKNFIVRNYVPQLAVLKKTKVYISHGGMGGISESIFFSVPMLLLPKTIEQQINANRMNELGASVNLKDENVSGELLLRHTKALLGPERELYIESLKRIAQSFIDAGGVEPSVEAVERALFSGHVSGPNSPKPPRSDKSSRESFEMKMNSESASSSRDHSLVNALFNL